jgi:hypothetical protein
MKQTGLVTFEEMEDQKLSVRIGRSKRTEPDLILICYSKSRLKLTNLKSFSQYQNSRLLYIEIKFELEVLTWMKINKQIIYIRREAMV